MTDDEIVAWLTDHGGSFLIRPLAEGYQVQLLIHGRAVMSSYTRAGAIEAYINKEKHMSYYYGLCRICQQALSSSSSFIAYAILAKHPTVIDLAGKPPGPGIMLVCQSCIEFLQIESPGKE
jgi:hypothetical protein